MQSFTEEHLITQVITHTKEVSLHKETQTEIDVAQL